MAKPTTCLFLDNRRPLKDGTLPLKLTVYYLGKKMRYKTPFKLTQDDFQKIQKSNLRDTELKNMKSRIYKWLDEQTQIALSIEDFSFDTFEKIFTKDEVATMHKMKSELVQPLFVEYISKLKKQERIKTAESYQSALNSLLSFRRYLKFQDITPDFLEAYEIWMLSNNKTKTSVGVYLRSFRKIYNIALEKGIVEYSAYPFKKYTIPAPRKSKRAFKEEQIKAIFNTKPETEKEQKALDFWRFSFLCNGINLKDIAHLKWANISGDTMFYNRKKTEKTKRDNVYPIKVHLDKHAHDIIRKWANPNKDPDNYVFPILESGLSIREKENRIAYFTKTTNKYLKRLGVSLGLDTLLTTYTARHSYATKLKNSEKVSLPYIMESLGHSSMKTTMDYLSGFEDDTIKKHHAVLLEGLEE
jgi:integrase